MTEQVGIKQGPEDPVVLHLQDSHRSKAVWNGHPCGKQPLNCRAHSRSLAWWDVDHRVETFISGTQFFGVARLSRIPIDSALITALVERWRQETHTFHLPVGEVAPTLEDVQVLTGLQVRGDAVCADMGVIWEDLVDRCLGVRPEVGKGKPLNGSALKLGWLFDQFEGVPDDANDYTLSCHIRAYLLYLCGTILFVDKSGNEVQLPYLLEFEDLDRGLDLSWGSAVLACLYRNLCKATNPRAIEIAGPLVILQLWAWERIAVSRPVVTPKEMGFNTILGSQHIPHYDSLGARWTRVIRDFSGVSSTLPAYRDSLDNMVEGQFIWQPYTHEILSFLSPRCTVDRTDYLVRVPLVCFDMVEWHFPDRVKRQFGLRQEVPQLCDTKAALHKLDRRGNHERKWKSLVHRIHLQTWGDRARHIVQGELTLIPMQYQDQYMKWYRRITVRYVSPPSMSDAACSSQPTTADVHLLAQAHARIYQTCQYDLANWNPYEIPHPVREKVREVRDIARSALERVGQGHLILGEQNPQPTPNTLQEDAPFAHHTRRQHHRQSQSSTPLSPVMEEDTPTNSQGRGRGRGKKKRRNQD